MDGELQGLSPALKAAGQSPRFLRSMDQWHAIFTKMAVLLVGCEQMTHAMVAAHRDNICRMVTRAKFESVPVHTVILYEDLARRSWAQRSQRKDDSLCIKIECGQLVKQLWEAANQRIAQVLSNVNLEQFPPRPPGHAPGLSPAQSLSDQTQAAEQMRRQAQAAGDRLAAQQAQLMDQQKYMLGAIDPGNFRGDSSNKGGGKGKNGGGKGGAKNGNGGQMSKRKIKSAAYVSWVRDVKSKKQGDWSGSWSGGGSKAQSWT